MHEAAFLTRRFSNKTRQRNFWIPLSTLASEQLSEVYELIQSMHLKNDHGELETPELTCGEVRNLASRRPAYNLLAQHPTHLFSHGCGNIAQGESTSSSGFPFMTS